MSTVNHITIPRSVATNDDLDFQYLKRLGIEYIESLGGRIWTDYNEHDPGITFLELLCYAITDLGNRIELPIEDLLANENGTGLTGQFFTASQILPNRALTQLDYRKLFIDLEGVRNCWLSPHKKTVYVNCLEDKLAYDPALAYSPGLDLKYQRKFEYKGLYDLLVDFDIPENIKVGSPEYDAAVKAIRKTIRTRFHEHRNLCEDLIHIKEVKEQPVSVCAHIELEKEADEAKVQAEITFAIRRYFAPQVNFYTLKEMQDKNYRTDQIFDGPLLEHGFIDSEELRNSTLRSQVHLSDLMNIITSIEGVKVIKDIMIGNCDGEESYDDWLICIEEGKRPVLCANSSFSFFKDVLPLVVNQNEMQAYLDELEAEFRNDRNLSGLDKTIPLPDATYLDTDWYTTMQNDLPDTYGISPFGLPAGATTERKSQARQLKAYLLFFDQILASYFAQLGMVRDLLSIDNDLRRTYFTQAVQDISGLSELISASDYPENDPELLSEYLLESLDDIYARKNQLLDHLIARFAERFSEYTFLMKQLYGTASAELEVQAKKDFLRDYDWISMNRGGGLNYFEQPPTKLWDTDNVSGVEHRVARLAGFKSKDFWRRDISKSFVDIYPDGPNFRWRIYDATNAIVLSATDDYPTYSKAMNELHLAVLHIIQTTEKEVQQAYDEGGFVQDAIVGNFYIRISGTGTYSFDILDKDKPDPDFIIARQYIQYNTAEELLEAMLYIMHFMKYDFSEEGIFLVEHILLRPDVTRTDVPVEEFIPVKLNDCIECDCIDPYSYRVTVVLPGYTQRFSDVDFREFLEEMIREEMPSHIIPKICWVGERRGSVPDKDNDLYNFEVAWKKFLLKRTNLGQAHHPATLKALNKAIKNLNTIYPSGRLHDCKTNDLDGKIILGRTNLGTL